MLSGMSTDYYARLEQGRGPAPSESVLKSIADGLGLSAQERDHLFGLAGRQAPSAPPREERVSPGLLRLLDLLRNSPAQVATLAAETLAQTPLSIALFGDEMAYDGLDRSLIHRWFTRSETRHVYPECDHTDLSRALTAQLRAAYSHQGPGGMAEEIVETLLETSAEFASFWRAHEINTYYDGYRKRVLHPELGLLDLDCQLLFGSGRWQGLLVLSAAPDSAAHRKLDVLSAATQHLTA